MEDSGEVVGGRSRGIEGRGKGLGNRGVEAGNVWGKQECGNCVCLGIRCQREGDLQLIPREGEDQHRGIGELLMIEGIF